MTTFIDRKNVDNVWTGGKQADYFNGAGGNDTIHGGGGDDTIYGGDGNDLLYGDDGNDTIRGDAGNDYLSGGNGNDDLRAGDGNDSLDGGAGIDGLTGGMGSDVLTGGAGSWDEFDYNSFAESSVTAGVDTITDFNLGEGDKIVLLNIDANAQAGLQYWDFVGAAPNPTFNANGNGQATLNCDGTTTTLALYNNDGDLNPDFVLHLTGYYDATNVQVQILDYATNTFHDGIV